MYYEALVARQVTALAIGSGHVPLVLPLVNVLDQLVRVVTCKARPSLEGWAVLTLGCRFVEDVLTRALGLVPMPHTCALPAQAGQAQV